MEAVAAAATERQILIFWNNATDLDFFRCFFSCAIALESVGCCFCALDLHKRKKKNAAHEAIVFIDNTMFLFQVFGCTFLLSKKKEINKNFLCQTTNFTLSTQAYWEIRRKKTFDFALTTLWNTNKKDFIEKATNSTKPRKSKWICLLRRKRRKKW